MEEKKIRKTVIVFYVAKILSMHITLTYGVYALMLKHNDLNFIEINTVNIFFMVAVFLFEVPTGSYADAFGHKKSFVAGLMIEAVGLVVYFLGSSFWDFVMAELVLAFASALQSGSLNAWAINKFRRLGWRSGYNELFSKAFICQRLATLVLSWAGAKIGHYFGLSMPFLIAGILALVSAFTTWWLLNNGDQPRQRVKVQAWQVFVQNIAQGRRIIVANNKLLVLFGVGFIASLMVQPINMQWSVLYEASFATTDLSTPVFFQVLGTIIGAGLMVEFARRIKKMAIQLLLISSGIGFTIMLIPMQSDWGLFMAVMFAHEIPRGLLEPFSNSWINELTEDDERRATVNSYFSMIRILAAAAGLLLSGFWAQWYGIKQTWLLIGGIGMVVVVLFLVISKGKQKRPQIRP